MFHADFLRATTKSFFKLKPELFAKQHAQLLKSRSWSSIQQEILISTPRRFGKTISVSMFAAALVRQFKSVLVNFLLNLLWRYLLFVWHNLHILC